MSQPFENFGNDLFMESGLVRCDSTDTAVSHIHPSYELLYFPGYPTATILANGQCVRIDFPAMILFAPYCMHYVYYDTFVHTPGHPWKKWGAIYIGNDFLTSMPPEMASPQELLKGGCTRIFDITDYDTVFRNLLFHTFRLDSPSAVRIKAPTLAHRFMTGQLLEMLSEYFGQDTQRILSGKAGYIPDVIQYIIQNISQNLKTEQIAEHFFVCRDKLNRDFRAYMQITVRDFITSYRLNSAKFYLRKNELSNREIASLCGFENEVYFYIFFKKHTDMSPGEYRISEPD